MAKINTEVAQPLTLSATPAQQSPLLAVGQYTFGPQVTTVGEAIHQVMRGTGYTFVSGAALSDEANHLLTQPLPLTQRHLGPLRVRDALNVLIGAPVYQLVVDPVHRQLSMQLNPHYQSLANQGGAA